MAAVCTFGCAPDDLQNADDDVSSSQALRPNGIVIVYNDDRPATNVRIGITATDQTTGVFYGGNAFIPGTIINQITNYSTNLTWSNNGLSLKTVADPDHFIGVDDVSPDPYRFTTMRVTINATITGNCHTDYEDIDLSSTVILHFDGHGGTWSNNCFRANFLYRVFP